MIRNCRYTGRGFDSRHLHQIYGGVTVSTGMTMVESRLLGAATARKLQTNNWKRLCITNGCLNGEPGFRVYLSTETLDLFSLMVIPFCEKIDHKVLGYHLRITYPTKSNGREV